MFLCCSFQMCSDMFIMYVLEFVSGSFCIVFLYGLYALCHEFHVILISICILWIWNVVCVLFHEVVHILCFFVCVSYDVASVSYDCACRSNVCCVWFSKVNCKCCSYVRRMAVSCDVVMFCLCVCVCMCFHCCCMLFLCGCMCISWICSCILCVL